MRIFDFVDRMVGNKQVVSKCRLATVESEVILLDVLVPGIILGFERNRTFVFIVTP